MQGIPHLFNVEEFEKTLRSLLNLTETHGMKVRSFSTYPIIHRKERIANVSFQKTPDALREGQEWELNYSTSTQKLLSLATTLS